MRSASLKGTIFRFDFECSYIHPEGKFRPKVSKLFLMNLSLLQIYCEFKDCGLFLDGGCP